MLCGFFNFRMTMGSVILYEKIENIVVVHVVFYHVHPKLRNGIKCLVNRPSFPCTYTATDCNNIFGRHEFDKEVVHAHFCAILTHMQTTENQKK
ncbi:Cysteine/serine-rich nuclear protein [Dirofilaria immitis]